MENAGKTSWRAETIRLTAFPTAMPDVSTIDWWETLVGEKPATKLIQPLAGTLQVSGPIKNGVCNLSLICQPTRVDWLLVPILDEKAQLTEFPSFGSLDDGIKLFNDLLLPWFKTSPSLQRVAFGAVLTQGVKDRKEGYQLLGNYLSSVKLDSERSREFSYQINKPRASKITELQINRLSRWSVAKLNGMVMQFSIGQEVVNKVFNSESGLSACRLELDINTSEEFKGELSKGKMDEIVRELVDMSNEIALKGDVA